MTIATYPPQNLAPSSTQLGYAEITANPATFSATTDIPGLAVTVYVAPGRRIKISGRVLIASSVADDSAEVYIYEDGVRRGTATLDLGPANRAQVFAPEFITSPTPGMHTYKLVGARFVGTGTLTLFAGVGYPGHILVEDITGSTAGPGPIVLAFAPLARGLDQGGITTTETAITGLSVTVSVPAGRILRVSARGGHFSTVANDRATIALKEGSTYLTFEENLVNPSYHTQYWINAIVQPSEGVHTYFATLQRSAGTGTLSHRSGGNDPAYIMVEDITGTPSPAGILPTSQTLAYAEVLSNQGSIGATQVDVAGLAATITVPSGRRIRISSRVYFTSTTSDGDALAAIWEGGTQLQESRGYVGGTTAPFAAETTVIVTPSAGTHTYKVVAKRVTGTGTLTTNAWANGPSYLLVEDITGGAPAVPAVNVPVGRIGYVEKVEAAPIAIPSGVYDIPGLSVTVTVPEGRTLKITTFVCMGGGATNEVRIYRGASQLNRSHFSSTAPGISSHTFSVTDSPSAGQHTYKVTSVNATAGTLYCDGVNECYLLVEDITPTPAPANTAPSSTLGYVENPALSQAVTTATALTNLSVSVTVPAGRRLRLSARAYANNSASDNRSKLYIAEGGAELGSDLINHSELSVNETLLAEAIVSPSAGAHTYIAGGIALDGGTSTFGGSSNLPAFLLVEDITGSGISGHTHTELDDTGWLIPTLLNSWVNYGGGWIGARYRRKAGIVYIQGLVRSGTSGSTVFTLPVGFRPSATEILMVTSVSGEPWAVTRVDITGSNGSVSATRPSDTWVTLTCSFPADG